jgi:dienelactone hydrolase
MTSRSLALLVALAACSSSKTPSGSADAPAQPQIDAPAQPQIDAPTTPPIDAPITGATDVPVVPCTAALADVYAATPDGSAALGQILACAPDQMIPMGSAQTRIGSAMTATSDVATFRIAYATRDWNGGPAVSTAEVYLPHTPRALPVPIVVGGHGSVGLADSCASSNTTDVNLSLPYAARGFAMIEPDLAGLGNAGTQAYLDNRAQGHQMLDGARALRALLAPGLTAQQLILTGYSQGGGAALSAQSLLRGDGPGIGQLQATVVYAPEWPDRVDSFMFNTILNNPTELTIELGLSYSSVQVLRQYAWFENHLGSGMGKLSVPASAQGGIDGAVDSLCLVEVGGYIQGTMLHLGDLMEPTFEAQVAACEAGSAAGCTGNGSAYYADMVSDTLASDPQAGPVLIVQGLADLIMQPADEAACVDAKLVAEGTDVSTCVFLTSDHSDIMDQHPTGEAWAESVLAGGTRAACPSTAALPACAP